MKREPPVGVGRKDSTRKIWVRPKNWAKHPTQREFKRGRGLCVPPCLKKIKTRKENEAHKYGLKNPNLEGPRGTNESGVCVVVGR